jgi:tetratricopeptide (TPR) repeat protein/peroxiredoxin
MVVVLGVEPGYGYLSFGQIAPSFSLKDLKDQTYDLTQMKERPMIVLYFFDVDSKPSKDGLLSLNQLAKQYKGGELIVWAITLSPKEKVSSFVSANRIGFPVLLDKSGISNAYQAHLILPTVCIVGPGLKILNYIQGGGKTSEVMLVSLAERELQRKQTKMAKVISRTVTKKDPRNKKARAVEGYAALKEGNLNEAEEVFKELAQYGDHGEILGKEGLAAVYAKRDQHEKALKYINEVEQKDPDRSYVYVLKGDLLYSMNRKKEAEDEYKKAAGKKSAEPYQEAVRYNKLGRTYAESGQYAKARELYDKAIEIDPYYIEGTTNKGVTYEKEGKYDKALESYKQAAAIDKSDIFAAVLAKKAQEMLELQRDAERKKRIDQLVKDLSERYRSQKGSPPKIEDEWMSQPMVISFVDFQEKGGLPERDGFSNVLTAQLTDYLNASGRVKVVERVLIERLLEELNLGTSDLANPETTLKLGKILAAKLIGMGSLYYMPQGTTLSLRLIDTETSTIPQITTKQMDPQKSLDKELLALNREILKTVVLKYPLRGFVAKVADDQVVINLGSKQGVVSGTKFDVVEEQEAIQYKGKTLKSAPKPIAQIEIVRTEPDLSYAKILTKERPVKIDDKVREKIEETVAK